MKQYVKALDRNGECFQYILSKFLSVSYEKIKAGVFDGPQIRTLMKDNTFPNSMNEIEKMPGYHS